MTLLGNVPREPRVSTRPPQVRGVVCKREGRQTFSVAPIQSVRLTAGSRGAQEIGIPIKLLQTRRRALLTGGAWIETLTVLARLALRDCRALLTGGAWIETAT